jgi:hypothetical protein
VRGAFSKGEIALADVPPKYAEELCSGYERCLGKEVYALFSNGTDCAKRTEQRILNGEFPQCADDGDAMCFSEHCAASAPQAKLPCN